jgi:hypothetical protein
MENKDAPAFVSDERGRLYGLISAWLIPAVPPSAIRCALAALIGVAMAVLMRVALLGLHGGVGATQPFFPPIMLVTLYAGWRWGLVPVAAAAGFGWWLWGGRDTTPLSEDELATMVIFLLSAVMVVAAAEGCAARCAASQRLARSAPRPRPACASPRPRRGSARGTTTW